jgi:hypothetical protein
VRLYLVWMTRFKSQMDHSSVWNKNILDLLVKIYFWLILFLNILYKYYFICNTSNELDTSYPQFGPAFNPPYLEQL